MLESLMLAQLGVLLKEAVGPLAKAAAEDLFKDRLKQGAEDVLALSAPDALKKAVKQSLKNFIQLFGAELENCGLPSALIKHELAEPIGRLLATELVTRELCRAFESGVERIDWQLLPDVWSTLSPPANFPEEFEWEALARNYVRRVKGLVRQDAELARQLELDQQRSLQESNEALVGVPVQFNLREYQESLKERFGGLSLDSLDTTGAAYDNLRLWKIFVAQDVRECAEFAPQMYELPKERLLALQAAGEIDPVLSVDELDQRRRRYAEKPIESVRGVVGLEGADAVLRSVILGDPGAGKSTLLRALALSWAEKSVAALKGEPIPLLIELRLYAQDKEKGICNDFLEYFHQGNAACRLNQLELDELLKGGKAVALFDGVDEVFDPKLREAVVTDIHRFSNRYEKVQMVVTSRWLGYKAQTLREAGFVHYMLQDLNDEQIEVFLEKWHGSTFTKGQKEERDRKQARLQKAIVESKAIRELARNPLLLTMMAILNRNQALPRDRARLYEEASKVLLYQWDVEGKLYQQADLQHWQIDVRDKQAMLRKVAHHMQANEEGLSGNVISRDDLEEILTDYLKQQDMDRAHPVARVMIEQLRERNFILCYLGADNYAFVHRTFLEYFCASEFVHQFEKEKRLDVDDLKSIYVAHIQKEEWHEVLRLIAGMIPHIFVSDIINCLIEQPMDCIELVEFVDGLRYSYATTKKEGINNLLLAADCLFETEQTSSSFVETKATLLAVMKERAENSFPFELGEDAASALVKSIVRNWGIDSETIDWLSERIEFDRGYVRSASVLSVAKHQRNNSNISKWLQSLAQQYQEEQLCIIAIQALSQYWKDEPGIVDIIQDCANQTESWQIRSFAVQALVDGWKDTLDIVEILKSQVSSTEGGEGRVALLRTLSRECRDLPELPELLLDRAYNDHYWGIRNAAVQELSWMLKDDPKTFSLLKNMSLQSEDGVVRRAAIRELAKFWRDKPCTVKIITEKAQEDEDENVRIAAIQELARLDRDNHAASNIIRRQAEEAESARVRFAAIREFTALGINDLDAWRTIKMRAKKDESFITDDDAVRELAKGWRDLPATLHCLKLWAQKENTIGLARTSIRMLARGWRSDSTVFEIIKKRAECNIGEDERIAAMQELARGWLKSPQLFDFWCERAIRDPFKRGQRGYEDNPRKIALEVLIRQYSNHPKTIELLRDRAQNDTDETLRTWATEQLSRLALATN